MGIRTDFIDFYRIGIEERRRATAPGARSESMQAWLGWMRDLEARGHLKSPGQPLEDTGKVVRGQAMTGESGGISNSDCARAISVDRIFARVRTAR
jgi:hypothetical protein